MPNKRGSSVAAPRPFEPRGLLDVRQESIRRPDGSTDSAIADILAGLGRTFGRIADEQAVIEGTRAGKIAGTDPAYRPTNVPTLRGQAFDQAATRTYLDTLEASLRRDVQALFEKHSADPAGLKAALDRLGEEYRQRDVFPEILGEFNAGFERLRLPYQNKALSNFEEDRRDRLKANLIANLNSLDTTTRQALAALDPDTPGAEDVVNSAVASTERVLREAADAGVISHAAAETSIIKTRQEVAIDVYMQRAAKMTTPQQVAEYRARLKTDFAAGKLKNLDGSAWQALDARLQQREKQLVTEGATAGNVLQKGLDDYVTRAVDGFPVSSGEWSELAALAKAVPNGDALLATAQSKLHLASVLRGRSVEEGERIVERMRQDLRDRGGASPAEVELTRFGEKYVADQRKALGTDMLGLAARKGLVPAVAPIDFTTFATAADPAAAADVLAGQLRARSAQARAVAAQFDRAPQFLRPDEKERLAEIVSQGGDRALQLARAIVTGAGGDAPALLREIGGDAPLLAQAGLLLASGGSVTAARDVLQAARLKAVPGARLAEVPSDRANAIVNRVIGRAYVEHPEDGMRIRAAANAITTTRLERERIDPKEAAALEIYERALQEAAGARYVDGIQYGGVADYKPGWWSTFKVLVPPSIKADRFRDVIRAITDEDLRSLSVPPQAADGRPYRARDLHGAVPIAVQGGYRFALGDPASDDPRYIRGADGRPFVLDIEALAPKLRSRVPGAFLGGGR